MEVKKITTTCGKSFPVSRLHSTMKSLSIKMGKEVSTIFNWKVKGLLESVMIGDHEYFVDPGENFVPPRFSSKDLRKEGK